jgi:hypothetical protein
MHLIGAPGVVHTTDHIDKKVHLNTGHPVVLTEHVIPADLSEPTNPLTVDTTSFTADASWPTADVTSLPASDTTDANREVIAVAIEAADATDALDAAAGIVAVMLEAADAAEITDAVSIVSADAIEGANALDDIDAAVGANVVSATVVEAADAADVVDATVEAAAGVVGGGRHYPRLRPYLVEGVGYGILQLEGEAHGVVGAAGQSAAQVLVRAAAIGACGQVGSAAVVLKALAVAGQGAIGARGAGSGVIMKLSGTATGRHDDDEAAVIAFLLAA